MVLLAPSVRGLQLSLDRFTAECEAAGMKISTSKSEAMVLDPVLRLRISGGEWVGG